MYENLDMNDQISNNLKHQTDVLVGARGKMDTISTEDHIRRLRTHSRP